MSKIIHHGGHRVFGFHKVFSVIFVPSVVDDLRAIAWRLSARWLGTNLRLSTGEGQSHGKKAGSTYEGNHENSRYGKG